MVSGVCVIASRNVAHQFTSSSSASSVHYGSFSLAFSEDNHEMLLSTAQSACVSVTSLMQTS